MTRELGGGNRRAAIIDQIKTCWYIHIYPNRRHRSVGDHRYCLAAKAQLHVPQLPQGRLPPIDNGAYSSPHHFSVPSRGSFAPSFGHGMVYCQWRFRDHVPLIRYNTTWNVYL